MRLPVSRLMMFRRVRLAVLLLGCLPHAHATGESEGELEITLPDRARCHDECSAVDANRTKWNAVLSRRVPATLSLDQWLSQIAGPGTVKPDLRFVFLMV